MSGLNMGGRETIAIVDKNLAEWIEKQKAENAAMRAQVQKADELLKDVQFALDFLSGGPYEWNPDFKAKIDAYFANKKS